MKPVRNLRGEGCSRYSRGKTFVLVVYLRWLPGKQFCLVSRWLDLGKTFWHKRVMRQTNYYPPRNCQDISLSVSRISLPSVLREGPLQHALQHLLQHATQRCFFYSVAWFPMEKNSSLFKRPLATNLAKNTLFALRAYVAHCVAECVAERCSVLQRQCNMPHRLCR